VPSNTQAWYRIEVFLKKKRVGTGLRVTRTIAFTAAHCFTGGVLKVGLNLRLEDGTAAEVSDFNIASDLVLLTLDDRHSTLGKWNSVGKCNRNDPWRALSHSDPKPLSGHVLDPSATYHKDGDVKVKALWLQCERPVGDRASYAGTPVEPHGPSAPATALGLMVRPPLQRLVENDHAFAISVKEAMELFGLLRPTGMARRSASPAQEGAVRRQSLGVQWTGRKRPRSIGGGA
jgi:hypothetical protein